MILRPALLAFTLATNPLAAQAQSAFDAPRAPDAILCDIENSWDEVKDLTATLKGEDFYIRDSKGYLGINGVTADELKLRLDAFHADRSERLGNMGFTQRELEPFNHQMDTLSQLTQELTDSLDATIMPEQGLTYEASCAEMQLSRLSGIQAHLKIS